MGGINSNQVGADKLTNNERALLSQDYQAIRQNQRKGMTS